MSPLENQAATCYTFSTHFDRGKDEPVDKQSYLIYPNYKLQGDATVLTL